MNLSLVVAIWDEDSKSRDDYMAGIRAVLPRSPISNIGQWNIVKLQHQEADGHVRVLAVASDRFYFEIFIASKCSI